MNIISEFSGHFLVMFKSKIQKELENISEHLTALCINVHSLQCLSHIFASFFAYGAVINGLPNIMEGRAS